MVDYALTRNLFWPIRLKKAHRVVPCMRSLFSYAEKKAKAPRGVCGALLRIGKEPFTPFVFLCFAMLRIENKLRIQGTTL